MQKTIIPVMSTPDFSHEFPPREVSWLQRDVLLFASSIGVKATDVHFLYVGSHGTLDFDGSNITTHVCRRNYTLASVCFRYTP